MTIYGTLNIWYVKLCGKEVRHELFDSITLIDNQRKQFRKQLFMLNLHNVDIKHHDELSEAKNWNQLTWMESDSFMQSIKIA